MLRITETIENKKAVRLRLDGSITDQNFADLMAVYANHRNGNDPTIIVDMAGVEFMSNDVAQKLIAMRGDRVRFINCSPFIDMLLGPLDGKDQEP
ncbi:MAG: STAS domain-containing protein [Candidatus Binatia bacterium]